MKANKTTKTPAYLGIILILVQIVSGVEGAQILNPDNGEQFKNSFNVDIEAEWYESGVENTPEVIVNLVYPNGESNTVSANQINGKLFRANFNDANKPIGTYEISAEVNYGSRETAQTETVEVLFDNKYTGDRNPRFKPNNRMVEWPQGQDNLNMSVILDETNELPERQISVECSSKYPESQLGTETKEMDGKQKFNCQIPGFFSTYTERPAEITIDLCDSLNNCYQTTKEYIFQKEKKANIVDVDYPEKSLGGFPLSIEWENEVSKIRLQSSNNSLDFSDFSGDSTVFDIPESALKPGRNQMSVILIDDKGERADVEEISVEKIRNPKYSIDFPEDIRLKKGESRELSLTLDNSGNTAYIDKTAIRITRDGSVIDELSFGNIKSGKSKKKTFEVNSNQKIGEETLTFESDVGKTQILLVTNPSVSTYIEFNEKYDSISSRLKIMKENISNLQHENKSDIENQLKTIESTLNQTEDLEEAQSYRYVRNIRNVEENLDEIEKKIESMDTGKNPITSILQNKLVQLSVYLLLFLGGIGLLYYNHRDRIINEAVKNFRRLTEEFEDGDEGIGESDGGDDDLEQDEENEDSEDIENSKEESVNEEEVENPEKEDDDLWHLP